MANKFESEQNWLSAKLDSLNPGEVTFNPSRARTMLRERSAGPGGRWAWAGAVAAALLVLIALPSPRAAAGRVWQRLFTMKVEQPAVRSAAADFALTDSTGKVVRLSDYRGQVVLLNFWATWCAPCQHEVPWFVDFQARFGDQGFTVLGISLDEEGWDAVRPFLAEKQVNYPVMLASSADLPQPYRSIGALPKTYLIDRDGHVAGEYDGLASADAYEKWIRSMLFH